MSLVNAASACKGDGHKTPLEVYLENSSEIRAFENLLLNMSLDQALVIMNKIVSNNTNFFALIRYLTAHEIRPDNDRMRFLLAADVMEDCRFWPDRPANTQAPVIMFMYAIARVKAAIDSGINVRRY